MSKKLLLSTDTKSSEIQEGYVTDGLILHLDAIDNTRSGHDYSGTVWEDLSGNGNDFNAINDIIFNRDKVCFRKETGYLEINDFSKWQTLCTGEEVFTLEVLFDFGNYSTNTSIYNCPIFVNDSSLLISLGYYIGLVYTSSDEIGRNGWVCSDYYNIDTTLSAITYSNSSNDALYINCESISISTSTEEDFYNTTNTVYIGRNDANTSYYIGNIKSIRLYNRALTQTEVQQNRLADEQRFDLNNVNKIIFTPGTNIDGNTGEDTTELYGFEDRVGCTQYYIPIIPGATYQLDIKGSNYCFIAEYDENKGFLKDIEYTSDEWEILTDTASYSHTLDTNTHFVRLGSISHLDYADTYDVVLTPIVTDSNGYIVVNDYNILPNKNIDTNDGSIIDDYNSFGIKIGVNEIPIEIDPTKTYKCELIGGGAFAIEQYKSDMTFISGTEYIFDLNTADYYSATISLDSNCKYIRLAILASTNFADVRKTLMLIKEVE